LQTDAERERAQEQIEEQQRTVDELSRQFEGQSADFQALQQLEQEAEATQVLYETFLTRLKETNVQGSIHESDSRILTEARVGEQVAPRSSRIMAMALLLGLLLGAGIVLLREFLQNTIRATEELEQHTGRTVLGQFPRVPARSRPDTIKYLLNKPTSAAAEAIRNLRTSLLLSNVDHPPKVIMVTSSVPNEGKTTLTIALAQNLAGLNKRVLLVEGDIRRRTFQAYFPEIKSQHGLVSTIAGQSVLAEAVGRPDSLGIDVLLGERRSSINAADLFSSESFRSLIETARAEYDYIIIDTPPVLVVPDARVIANQADAVVYVVRWDHTTKSQVEEGLRQFRSVNVPVTGLVLSQVDPKGMKRYGYGGRYGAYSRYGRNYYET
jgi:capsular exopolysaccharide synthesis family protein